MQCPNCQASIDDSTIYCGNCGKQVAPLQAQGATVNYPLEGENPTLGALSRPSSPPRVTPVVAGPIVRPWSDTPPPPMPQLVPRRRRPGLLVIALGLLILLAGGTVLTLALLRNSQGAANSLTTNASGQVLFFDGTNGTGNTDALRITGSGLSAAPSGSHYDAWLVDEAGEHTAALGTLTEQGGAFSLNVAGNGGNGQAGTNLLSLGNVIEITLEQGKVKLPTGKVVLTATFPPNAFVHIKHLLFSFPTTPANIGLLVGLLEQTRLLSAQALALQSIASNQNAAAIQCIAQSIIDISEGQQGAHFQPLSAACGSSIPTGDGFGILGTNGYAATAATHASLAATQSDTTATIREHASEVEIGMTNITGWDTTIDQDALKLLENPNDQTSLQEIVVLADHAFHGVDTNGNGQIEPIAGEEGAATAYLRGQLMATLALVPSA